MNVFIWLFTKLFPRKYGLLRDEYVTIDIDEETSSEYSDV